MITIDDLEYTVCDVAFEGFVLNHYGNFGSSSVIAYFHVDVTNQFGISIVSVPISIGDIAQCEIYFVGTTCRSTTLL